MMQLCLNLKVLKHAIAAGKTNFKNRFASQIWAARPHLGSIFEKLLHRKTFYLCFAPAQQKTASPDKEKAVSNAILFDAVQNPFRLFPVPILPFSLAFDWYHFSEVYRRQKSTE